MIWECLICKTVRPGGDAPAESHSSIAEANIDDSLESSLEVQGAVGRQTNNDQRLFVR